MPFQWLLLFAWWLGVAGLGALRGSATSPTVVLDPTSFESAVLGGRHAWVVEFYNPGEEAQPLQREAERAVAALKGMCRFGMLDVTGPVAAHLVEQYELRTLPALRFFARNLDLGQGHPLEGQEEAIVAFIKGVLPNTVATLSSVADLQPPGTSRQAGPQLPWVLLFTEKKATPTLFKALAVVFKGELRFGDVRDNPLLEETFGVTVRPTVLVVSELPEDSGSKLGFDLRPYSGPLTYAALVDFLLPFADGGSGCGGSSTVEHEVHATDEPPEPPEADGQNEWQHPSGLLFDAEALTVDELMALPDSGVPEPL